MEGDNQVENLASNQPTFITNNKGNLQLVDDDSNFYHKSRSSNNNVYWDCYKKKYTKCQGRAVTSKHPLTGQMFVKFTGEHNHVSSLAKVHAKVIDREIINAGVSNATMVPSRLIAEILNDGIHESILMARRKSSNLIRTIQYKRVREKGHTNVPPTMEAIMDGPLPEKFTTTAAGDQFLVVKDFVSDEMNKTFLIFMSPLGKEMLSSSIHWVSDGTFKTVPRPFQDGQIYIVFAQLPTGELLPCLFSLLPDKSSISYRRMWGALHQELSSAGAIQFEGPGSIGMDFEVAPATEMKNFFPATKISGCFFHWRKALIDQIGKKGCKTFYNTSIDFQDLVGKCVAMALVPVDKIETYFQLVETLFSELEDGLQEGAVDWFNYFARTFVGRKLNHLGARKPPLFSHELWNKYQEFINDLPTTTNQAEAFKGAWKLRNDSSPSFWSILDGFKREEALAAQKWRESIVNVRIQPENPTEGTSRMLLQRERKGKIRNVLLKEGSIPGKHYLSMISTLLKEI